MSPPFFPNTPVSLLNGEEGVVVGGGRTSVGIYYGDIIKLMAPTHAKVHEQLFFVDYIDSHILRLIDLNDYDNTLLLRIEWDAETKEGFLFDSTIEQIRLISRGEDLGYVKINGLSKGKFVWIDFTVPDAPSIRAEIKDIIRDAVELLDVETKETLYLDFEYKGLPEYIQRIRIIQEPTAVSSSPMEQEPIDIDEPDDLVEVYEHLDTLSRQGDSLVRNMIQNNDVADDLDEIEVEIEIPENRKRYTLDVQLQDISDHLYSKYPAYLQTPDVDNEITNTLNRFVEMRQTFSRFEENGVIVPTHADTCPAIRSFLNGTTSAVYRPFVPVVDFVKKIYVGKVEKAAGLFQQTSISLIDDKENTEEKVLAKENYQQNVQQGDENKYNRYIRHLSEKPFQPRTYDTPQPFIKQTVGTEQPQEWIIHSSENGGGEIEAPYLHYMKSSRDESEIQQIPFSVQRVFKTPSYVEKDVVAIRSFMTNSVENMEKSRLFLPQTPLSQQILLSDGNSSCSGGGGMVGGPFLTEQDVMDAPHVKIPVDGEELYVQYKPVLAQLDIPKAKAAKATKKKSERLVPEFGSRPIHFYFPRSTGKNPSLMDSLQTVLPKTSYYLEWMNHKGYLENTFSFTSLVHELEPMAIYPHHIRIPEQRKIKEILSKNIHRFVKNWRTRSGELLKQYQGFLSYYRNVRWNDLFKMFTTPEGIGRLEQLKNAYQVDFMENNRFRAQVGAPGAPGQGAAVAAGKRHWTNSELFHAFSTVDQNRLFDLTLLSMLLDWLTPEQFLSGVPNIDPYSKAKAFKMLSKQYSRLADLEKDNHTEDVFVDEDFLDNTTRDWILKFQPILKKETDETARREIVQQTLTDIYKLTNVESLVETILSGKKRVEDGDYAVLEIKKTAKVVRSGDDDETEHDLVVERRFYKRLHDIWVVDDKLREEDFSENIENLLGKYTDLKKNKAVVPEHILFTFEKRYSVIAEEMKAQLEEDIQKQMVWIQRKRQWNKTMPMLLQTRMKEQVALYEQEKKEDPILSPYVSLRDMVLEQTNEKKRQHDIQKFFERFCRKAILEEDCHWGYCLLTNTQLFPVPIYELAVAFNTGKSKLYREKLEEICSLHGTLSEDGGRWIDKNSGYTLRLIDQSTTEGGDTLEYHMLAVSKVLQNETDVQIVIESMFESDPTNTNIDTVTDTQNIVQTIFRFMNKQVGIHDKNMSVFHEINMLYHKTVNDTHVILSKKKYEANLAAKYKDREKTRVRKEPPYEMYLDQMYVYVAVSCYFVIVQMNLPKLRRTNMASVVGCKYSFDGFPMENDSEKDTGIRFMSCLLQASKKLDERPWNALQQHSSDSMVKYMKQIINTIVMIPSVKNAIGLRREKKTVEKNPVDSTPSWPHFLPPLVKFSVISSIPTEGQAVRVLVDGFMHSAKKRPYLLKLKSWVLLLTYGMVERINGIVLKTKMLMKTMNNVPYLENMCCDQDNRFRNPLFYFANEDANILTYLEQGRELERHFDRIAILSIPPSLFYRITSQPVLLTTPSTVTDPETIQRVFIHYAYDLGYWDTPEIQSIMALPAPPEEYHRQWADSLKKDFFLKTFEKTGKWTELRTLMPTFMKKIYQSRPIQVIPPKDLDVLRNDMQGLFLDNMERFTNSVHSNAVYHYFAEHVTENQHMDPKEAIPLLDIVRQQLLRQLETEGVVVPTALVKMPVTTEKAPGVSMAKITFMKNSLEYLLRTLPSVLLYKQTDAVLPKHWVFSKSDSDKLQDALNRIRKPMNDLALSKNTEFIQWMTKIRGSFQELYHVYVSTVEELFESPEFLFEYYSFLLVETVYLYIEEFYAEDKHPVHKAVLTEYLNTCLDILEKNRQIMFMDYATLVEKTRFDENMERQSIMDRFKMITRNDERALEKLMKKLKLGRWNVGKEVYQYNKNAPPSENDPTMNLYEEEVEIPVRPVEPTGMEVNSYDVDGEYDLEGDELGEDDYEALGEENDEYENEEWEDYEES